MAENTTDSPTQIIKSYSAKPKIKTNPIIKEAVKKVTEETKDQQEAKNESSPGNLKVLNGKVSPPLTPKKIYVIKTVKNQSLLEKLKSGKIVVKKIVLPGNKAPEDAKKLPTPKPTPNIHIQENIRLEGPKKEQKEKPKLVILSDQRIPSLSPKKVVNVVEKEEKNNSEAIKDNNDLGEVKVENNSEEVKVENDSEEIIYNSVDIKDENDLDQIEEVKDLDVVKDNNSDNIKEVKNSDNVKDNDSDDLEETDLEEEEASSDDYIPNTKFKHIEVKNTNKKRNRRKPVYLRNDYLDPDFSDNSDEDEEEKEEPTTPPVKRRRGRPRRSDTVQTSENEENIPNTSSSSDIKDTTISPIKKRGPGRPRKHNIDETEKIEKPVGPPRKRGRPRKTLREFVENVEPKSCWSNDSDQNDPDFEPDSKGFKVAEATSAAQCHRVLEQEVENLEDNLPLSSVKDVPPKKMKKIRTPSPIKRINKRIQELIPKEFAIEAPPTHILIDNCHYPIVTSIRKLTIDPSKPLLIIDRETSEKMFYSFISNLDNYNIILKDENFEDVHLKEFLETSLLKEIITRKKITFVTNHVLAQHFQAASK